MSGTKKGSNGHLRESRGIQQREGPPCPLIWLQHPSSQAPSLRKLNQRTVTFGEEPTKNVSHHPPVKATKNQAPQYTQFSIFSILFIRMNKQSRSTRHWKKGLQHERKKPKDITAKRNVQETESVQETEIFFKFSKF